eukprot:COSAG02_NODE_1727_length_11182_cov_40.189209_5_plen_102_part_00
MASHNIALGIPMHANKLLLTDVLRDRFGLGGGGYIGSDADNVYQLSHMSSPGAGGYGIAAGAADATQLWMNAGGKLYFFTRSHGHNRSCCRALFPVQCNCR